MLCDGRSLAPSSTRPAGVRTLLRHSLATAMLRNGASLEEIGRILRHSLPSTTQVYAKVDLEALALRCGRLARRRSMTVLRQLLDEYLATRRALGVRLERDGMQLQSFVAFIELHHARHIYHRDGTAVGDKVTRRAALPARPAPGARCASSLAMPMPRTRATRSRRPACCPPGRDAPCPTPTATLRSTSSSAGPVRCLAPPGSGPAPMPRCWLWWRSPGCARPSRCGSTGATSTSTRAS